MFQGPFQAILVDGDEYLLGLTRYIHRNPLKAGLVERLEDWEFSSYPEYVATRGGSLPEPEMILEMIGSRERYREFVESSEEESLPSLEGLVADEEI